MRAFPINLADAGMEREGERSLERLAPSAGYPELNRLVKGFIPGHLYVVSGATNVGKTSLAANFAVRVARQKKRVLYIALEPGNTIVDYIASVKTGKEMGQVTVDDILEEEEFIDILRNDQIKNIQDIPDTLLDTSQSYDLAIIDHIGYFVTSQNSWLQQQSNVVKNLVKIAKSRQMAVMAIAHLRKPPNQGKNWQPSLHDISGSAAMTQDATDVMLVVRNPDPSDESGTKFLNTGNLYVVKTKSGPNGHFPVYFSDRKALIVSEEEISAIKQLSEDPSSLFGEV